MLLIPSFHSSVEVVQSIKTDTGYYIVAFLNSWEVFLQTGEPPLPTFLGINFQIVPPYTSWIIQFIIKKYEFWPYLWQTNYFFVTIYQMLITPRTKNYFSGIYFNSMWPKIFGWPYGLYVIYPIPMKISSCQLKFVANIII